MCREPTHCFAMWRAEGHPLAAELIAAARAMLGVRFRPQGRGAGGVDCLGLVLCAGAAVGLRLPPLTFPLRGAGLADAWAELRRAGCLQVENALPGDVLLGAPATRQVHLAFRSERGTIEAHAGIGRVVERPLAGDETWDSVWRLPAGKN